MNPQAFELRGECVVEPGEHRVLSLYVPAPRDFMVRELHVDEGEGIAARWFLPIFDRYLTPDHEPLVGVKFGTFCPVLFRASEARLYLGKHVVERATLDGKLYHYREDARAAKAAYCKANGIRMTSAAVHYGDDGDDRHGYY